MITQRHAKAHLGGLWEFPGGKLEAGETYEQCLAREIREELGVEIAVGYCFAEITHEYPEKNSIEIFPRGADVRRTAAARLRGV